MTKTPEHRECANCGTHGSIFDDRMAHMEEARRMFAEMRRQED